MCVCVSRRGCGRNKAEADVVSRSQTQSQAHRQRQSDPGSDDALGEEVYTREALKLLQRNTQREGVNILTL